MSLLSLPPLNPLGLLANLPWKIIGYTALVGAIFMSGAFWQGKRDATAEMKRAQKALTEYAQKVNAEITRSQVLSAKIEGEIKDDASRQAALKNLVVDHLQSRLTHAQDKINALEKLGVPKQQLVEVCSLGDLYRVDTATVGLLNAAALDQPAPVPASGTDEKVGTLTGVTANDLVEDRLTITKLYRALAKRHDSLVDWILDKQKETPN